jgi:hypothetical protein
MGLTVLGLIATSVLVGLITEMVATVVPASYEWLLIVLMLPGLTVTRYLDRTVDRAHADGHPGLQDRNRDIVLALGRHAAEVDR